MTHWQISKSVPLICYSEIYYFEHYTYALLSLLLTLFSKLHLNYTTITSKSAYLSKMEKISINLYVFINFLAIIGFIGTHLHAFIKLVDPLKRQQGWVASLRQGS